MRHDNSPALTWPLRRANTCVVEGYGIRMYVRNGQLVIEDGFGRERHRRVYSRATHGLARVVLLGHEGFITLEAVRWLTDLGISYAQIDRGGHVLMTSHTSAGDVRLRRAQALSASTTTGIEIMRRLIYKKIEGQTHVLETLDVQPPTKQAMARSLQDLTEAASLELIATAERQAALAYWAEWAWSEVRFSARDQQRVPEHWLRFGQRGSALTGGPRNALNPANALLNYLYAVLEAETKTACLICGLDPGLGLLHVDYRTRDSFVLDLMEPIRPNVDLFVLELLQTRTFTRNDFGETRRGVCRVLAPLSHELAKTAADWKRLIAPIAETVADQLASTPGSRIGRMTTPLTGSNRAAGRVRKRRRRERQSLPKPPRNCRGCGGGVPHPERAYCNDCLPSYEQRQLTRFSGSGLAAIEHQKASGHDPTHGGGAAKRRGKATSERKRQIADWEREHGRPGDLEQFKQKILPSIQTIPLSELVRATGLSLRYCSQIRRGERTPHPRHWEAFRSLALRHRG